MVLDTLGTRVCGRPEFRAGPTKGGALENFSKVQVSAIKNESIFLRKPFNYLGSKLNR